jgi:hypothetical protein
VTPYDAPDQGGCWREAASAVDYLADTTRDGLTVWGALTEAITAWMAGDDDEGHDAHVPWDDPDPLRTALERLLATSPPATSPGGVPLGELLGAALASWVRERADEVNDGHPFLRNG